LPRAASPMPVSGKKKQGCGWRSGKDPNPSNLHAR
jgi:hypothetical protein